MAFKKIDHFSSISVGEHTWPPMAGTI